MLKVGVAIIAVLVAVLAAAVLVLRATGMWDRLLPPHPSRVIDFQTLARSETPNHYLICPPGYCRRTEPDAASPEYAVSRQDLHAAFLAMLAEQPNLVIESDDGETIEIVQRTPLMRFPDRVTVRLVPIAGGKATLAIFSRSTYGSGDLGTNRARVTAWLERLSELLEQ